MQWQKVGDCLSIEAERAAAEYRSSAITETIIKLIEDSDLLNKLAANGKKTSRKYRMENVAGELKEIYLNER